MSRRAAFKPWSWIAEFSGLDRTVYSSSSAQALQKSRHVFSQKHCSKLSYLNAFRFPAQHANSLWPETQFILVWIFVCSFSWLFWVCDRHQNVAVSFLKNIYCRSVCSHLCQGSLVAFVIFFFFCREVLNIKIKFKQSHLWRLIARQSSHSSNDVNKLVELSRGLTASVLDIDPSKGHSNFFSETFGFFFL